MMSAQEKNKIMNKLSLPFRPNIFFIDMRKKVILQISYDNVPQKRVKIIQNIIIK